MAVTKLKPAPLKFPQGGGLKAMSNTPKSQSLEMDALKAKHKVEIAKLEEKHAAVNKPKPMQKKKAK